MAPSHGNAETFDDCLEKLRLTFDRWLQWATEMPPADLKHRQLQLDLRRIGAIK